MDRVGMGPARYGVTSVIMGLFFIGLAEADGLQSQYAVARPFNSYEEIKWLIRIGLVREFVSLQRCHIWVLF